jgi:CMP-N,N'-diacetyllegionaminic acid synthase
MRILALITARGGSKRVPGKNIRLLGGKPLIVWSIDVAKDIPEICDILVSTDDSAIAAISKDAGVLVPWLRPAELSTDTANSVDVAIHALDWYESEKGMVDGLLLLQPTSPFRTKETLQKGIKLFERHHFQPVLGVSRTYAHPRLTFRIEGDFLLPYAPESLLVTRTQDLSPVYVVNGNCYLITPSEVRAGRTFIGPKIIPLLVTSPKEAIDIDTEWDWKTAEAALALSEF